MKDEMQIELESDAELGDTSSFLWSVHSYLTTFIQFADVKAGVVIVWCSSVLGWLSSEGYAKYLVNSTYWQSHTKLVLAAAATAVLLSAAFSASMLVVYPALGYVKKRKASRGAPDHLIFWGSIVNHKRQEYIKSVGARTKLDLATANHVYDLAGVAHKKYFFLRWGIGLAAVGSLLALFCVALSSPVP